MGGEGVPWIGQAPFTDEKHIFANLGDGTYYHSGILAIRAAVAAKRQHHLQDPLQRRGGDDRRPAGRRPALAGRHRAAGRRRRREDDRRGQRRAGQVSVRLFRRRHRDPPSRRARRRAARAARDRRAARCCSTTRPAPPRSAAAASAASSPIPPSAWSSTSWCAKAAATAACKSNCVSVAPVETEFGRKRTIDQSSCNKDYSCVNGFCPSFVTVEGGTLRKPQKAEAGEFSGAARARAAVDGRAVRHPRHRHRRHRRGHHRRAARHGRAPRRQGLQRARHDRPRAEERRGGLARAHRRHARAACTRRASPPARRKLVLACDILTGVGYEALAKMQKGVTKALVNTALVMPARLHARPRPRVPARLDGAGDQGRRRARRRRVPRRDASSPPG